MSRSYRPDPLDGLPGSRGRKAAGSYAGRAPANRDLDSDPGGSRADESEGVDDAKHTRRCRRAINSGSSLRPRCRRYCDHLRRGPDCAPGNGCSVSGSICLITFDSSPG